MKEVFEDLPEVELLKRKREFDHAINLTIGILSKTLIILLQPDNQVFVKNYLDSMLRKRYIQISKSSIRKLLFFVSKKDNK